MNARTVYVVEDVHGNPITASTNEQQARELGEDVQEFNPDVLFYMQQYPLH